MCEAVLCEKVWDLLGICQCLFGVFFERFWVGFEGLVVHIGIEGFFESFGKAGKAL